jgi:hypothetical protein
MRNLPSNQKRRPTLSYPSLEQMGNPLDQVFIIFARDGSIKYHGANENTKDEFKLGLQELLARKPYAVW